MFNSKIISKVTFIEALKIDLIVNNLIERNKMNKDNRIIAKNPNAYHNFEIIETIEAGIVLYGTEIKSIRAGKVNLKDSYATIEKNGEVYVYSMNISPYEHGNIFNLLLNKREIHKLIGMTTQKGFALVPTKIYFKGNFVKLELGVGRGKKLYDKREDLKKKEAQRKIERYMKQ